ncbi:MAG TPA: SRPBCC domain-containing protein [Caulobacteraceae bacterium]|jgi:uncharacterized protein YndB with AHSA1/START domain/outer membrane protein OmpA-like peptidoglycan-associated protein|nr:SRPBCC domain-containing protein [Caulobacteraceae bacterium]
MSPTGISARQTRSTPYREANDLRLGGFIDHRTFRFVREYPHPPKRVWSALTEPSQLGVWLWPCEKFEARLGGVGVFNPGKRVTLQVTEFDPPRRLSLSELIAFTVEATPGGSRLTVDLSRPPDGWSPMGLAGYHGWLGRLSRLLAGRPQDETETWASGIWNAVLAHCEWEVSRFVAGGERALWRIHFQENESAVTTEAAGGLDQLAALLCERNLSATIDGFGDDPCDMQESLALCDDRIKAVIAHLQARGLSRDRINVGFVLGNYHYLAERESAAGRAFNRRIEVRPVY